MSPTTLGVDELGTLLRRAHQDEAPPAAARARAITLGGATRAWAAQAAAVLRRVAAVPVFGASSGLAPAFGVRGPAVPLHWLLRAEECEIDLRVSSRGETWTIAGQLFGAVGARQVLLSGPQVEAVAQLGENCEFTFSDLPSGRYSVTIKAPQVDLVVPQFQVGDAVEASPG